MNEFHPEPKQLLECERETLQFLKDHLKDQEQFAELANEAKVYYFKTKYRANTTPFYFESRFGIKIEGRDGYAHISSEIEKNEGKFQKISHNLAIYEQSNNTTKILRKFHFDYDPPGTIHRQPHPIFHLQYAGKLSKRLRTMNPDASDLNMDLNGPRLCYFPTSLALLIHFILIEFPSEENKKLSELSIWREMVRRNEKEILAPFFRNCHLFFSNRCNNSLFINDFYYGN